jgi:hypothetical protein
VLTCHTSSLSSVVLLIMGLYWFLVVVRGFLGKDWGIRAVSFIQEWLSPDSVAVLFTFESLGTIRPVNRRI